MSAERGVSTPRKMRIDWNEAAERDGRGVQLTPAIQ
jgi:hypothetical protein